MIRLSSPRKFMALLLMVFAVLSAHAAEERNDPEHRLVAGDVVRITPFQSADMQVDVPVGEGGTINYPLVGIVDVAGMTVAAVEQKLFGLLKQNGFEIGRQQLSLALLKRSEMQAAAAVQGGAKDVGTKDVGVKDAGVRDAGVRDAGVKADYRLGPGDGIRITVFQNPDLSLEARLSETGTITYPLVGTVELAGLTIGSAEQRLAAMLRDGGFVIDPQLAIALLQVRGNQVSVLGQVSKPGRYPLEQTNMKVTDILALAGGVLPTAADSVLLVGMRDGKTVRRTIDVVGMLIDGGQERDIAVENGDIFYVNRAPLFYIYGEVQRPGSFRLERDMTLMQALAQGGGITQRGTERGLRVHRRNPATAKVERLELDMEEPIRADDVIYVRESLF